MFSSITFWKKSAVRCYFITGTGRCGTLLMSKLLSLGSNTRCDHERSIKYDKMKGAYLTGDRGDLHREIDTVIQPQVKLFNRRGKSYGESSGLMYLAFDELYRRYKGKAKFVLLTRDPAEFVRSALARGFFDGDHPNPVEHIRAKDNTDIGQRWEQISPFEKCLWYWNVVNMLIYDFFRTLPRELWKIQPIEQLDTKACYELYEFLHIKGFNERAVDELLSKRINATPGRGDERYLNPYATGLRVGEWPTWSPDQKSAYGKWINPIVGNFYPSAFLRF
jgi:hypothetical protein